MPHLVFIPGLLNDADLWRDQVAALSPAVTCQVADITRGETMAALAEQVLASAPPRFALAGFSLGGYVAQEMLRQTPSRIERLALLDTSIKPDDPERAQARRRVEQAARSPGRFHGFGEKLLRSYVHPSNAAVPCIAARIRAMTERLGAEVFLRQSALGRTDGAAVLRGLSCPVLILCGDSDRITPPQEHERMASLAPRARLVRVPRCGHLTPIEAPDAVTAALRDWLAVPA